MNNVIRPRPVARISGFSLVEMIGVLAIIAILAVVIVPKVFSTIASSRVTSAIGSTNSMKTAVTDFAGKYGTIPLSTATSRIDDLLVTTAALVPVAAICDTPRNRESRLLPVRQRQE